MPGGFDTAVVRRGRVNAAFQGLKEGESVAIVGTVETIEAAPTFDSGVVSLPNVLTVLTALTVNVHGILFCNTSAVTQQITVTDTAGVARMNLFSLAARNTLFMPFGRARMVGIKWNAATAGVVNAQLMGETV